MIDLKNIHEMWQADSTIDSMHLDETSRKTPLLHAKYLELLSTAKLQLKREEFSQKTLLKNKWLYYNDADPEIQKSEEKIQYYKTVIETLIDIVDNLKWRHQTISNIIKWKQFESGN